MYSDFCEQFFENSLFSMFNLPYYYFEDCISPSFYIYTCMKEKESSSFSPKVNMYEDETKYFVHVDLPGMTRDQVKIEVNEEDRLLIISGERVSAEDKEKGKNTIEDDNQTEESNNESNENSIPKETNSNKKY